MRLIPFRQEFSIRLEKVLQVYVLSVSPFDCFCCFLLLLMLLFVKGIEVRITILVFIYLKFVVTLSKTDTF